MSTEQYIVVDQQEGVNPFLTKDALGRLVWGSHIALALRFDDPLRAMNAGVKSLEELGVLNAKQRVIVEPVIE